jgi:hypothetical protein
MIHRISPIVIAANIQAVWLTDEQVMIFRAISIICPSSISRFTSLFEIRVIIDL